MPRAFVYSSPRRKHAASKSRVICHGETSIVYEQSRNGPQPAHTLRHATQSETIPANSTKTPPSFRSRCTSHLTGFKAKTAQPHKRTRHRGCLWHLSTGYKIGISSPTLNPVPRTSRVSQIPVHMHTVTK